jgi:acylphosphatase
VTIRFIVSGRVQGVGYRYFARRAAVRLGLVGWVRNLPDGTVEAVAEGSGEALAGFAAELRKGPPMASVSAVHESEPQEQTGGLKSFQIR